jgi:hypothetical protein
VLVCRPKGGADYLQFSPVWRFQRGPYLLAEPRPKRTPPLASTRRLPDYFRLLGEAGRSGWGSFPSCCIRVLAAVRPLVSAGRWPARQRGWQECAPTTCGTRMPAFGSWQGAPCPTSKEISVTQRPRSLSETYGHIGEDHRIRRRIGASTFLSGSRMTHAGRPRDRVWTAR